MSLDEIKQAILALSPEEQGEIETYVESFPDAHEQKYDFEFEVRDRDLPEGVRGDSETARVKEEGGLQPHRGTAVSVTVDQLKEQISGLKPAHKRRLHAFFLCKRLMNEPGVREEVQRRLADEDPTHWISLEELERRLAEQDAAAE